MFQKGSLWGALKGGNVSKTFVGRKKIEGTSFAQLNLADLNMIKIMGS